VALDLTLDAELIRAGDAREIVHAIQACRKSTGLEISDRIELALGGDEGLLDAAREHEPHIARETLATSVAYPPDGERDSWSASIEIGGRELKIRLARA
jgi:isoleucyl-tRNA synthetase